MEKAIQSESLKQTWKRHTSGRYTSSFINLLFILLFTVVTRYFVFQATIDTPSSRTSPFLTISATRALSTLSNFALDFLALS